MREILNSYLADMQAQLQKEEFLSGAPGAGHDDNSESRSPCDSAAGECAP